MSKLKAMDLFQAYFENKLPSEGGYIISSYFDPNSAYSKYEVVSYMSVKSIYLTKEGLTFNSDGKKIYILVEPMNYSKKFIEPFRRDSYEQIPHRLSELNIITASNQSRIYISKEPVISYGCFTILKPTNINFAMLIYDNEDIEETLEMFFIKTLNKEAQIAQTDSKKAAKAFLEVWKKIRIGAEE